MVHCCCAYGCNNVFKKGKGLGFFRFPSSKSRRIQWIIAVRRKNFIPTNNTRICGAHFQTGRPSKDVDHPDYVPNKFIFNSCKQVKVRKTKLHTKKLLQDIRELPILKTEEASSSDDELEVSEVEIEDISRIDDEREFPQENNNSLCINEETVKWILEYDAANKKKATNTDSLNSENCFVPNLYTFIDMNGKILAKFSEKRVRKNARQDKIKKTYQNEWPSDTVRIILDKKNAKTVLVDRKAIVGFQLQKPRDIKSDYRKSSILNDSNELDYPLEDFQHQKPDGIKSEDRISCFINDSIEMFYPLEVKVEPGVSEKSNEDIVNLFSDLRSLEQQRKNVERNVVIQASTNGKIDDNYLKLFSELKALEKAKHNVEQKINDKFVLHVPS